MKYILPLLLTLLSNFAFSSEYLGPDLSSWPQTVSRKVKDNFAGWLLVTPDTDWLQKWDTPPDTIPYFSEASVVKRGDELVILPFYVNPRTDAERNAHVMCAIKVTRPNGSISIEQDNIICLKGELKGPSTHVRLSPTVIKFVGEPNDPLGVWVVEVTIHDILRSTILNLKTQFELVHN